MSVVTFARGESSPCDKVLRTVTAWDPGPRHALSHAISVGNTANAFAIDEGSGQLTLEEVAERPPLGQRTSATRLGPA